MSDNLIAQIKAGDIISPQVLKDAVVDLVDENERLRGLLNGNGWSDEELDKDVEIARLRDELYGNNPPKPMTGLFANLTPEQQRAALEVQIND